MKSKDNFSHWDILERIFATCLAVAASAASISTFALDPNQTLTQYGHDTWQMEDGLPKNSVNSVLQTRDGYLWLGTQGGVARFDGARFVTFDEGGAPPPGGHNNGRLFEDPSGTLWVASQGGGLVKCEGGQFTSYTTKDGFPTDILMCLCEDGEGGLWVGTHSSGLCRVKGGKVTLYTMADGLTSNAVRDLLYDGKGGIWIATDGGGLCRWQGGRFASVQGREGPLAPTIRCIQSDGVGGLWLGTNAGLDHFLGGEVIRYTTRDGLGNDLVLSLLRDSAGTLWVGTYGGGLGRFRDGAFASFTSKNGLSNDLVFSMFEDREGSLWVGTAGGLDRLRDGKFVPFGTSEGLSDDMVWCVQEGSDGALWAGTRLGLNRLKDGKVTRFGRKDGLADEMVWSVLEDSRGDLWIGTKGGLNRLSKGRMTRYSTSEGLTSNAILCLVEDLNGDILIGTEGGLNRYHEGRFSAVTSSDGLNNNTVIHILQDRSGRLWLCTRGKLDSIEGGRIVHHDFAAMGGLEDREGNLWFGTFGSGLALYKDGRCNMVTTREGLFDDVIFSVIEDREGYFWMTSSRGIGRASKADLLDVCEGRKTSLSCLHFGKADGMRSAECPGACQPTVWKAKDGGLWAATMKGVVHVDPSHLKINTLAPPVLIEDFLVSKRPVARSQGIELGPGAEEVEFRYTALSLLVPKRVEFKVKLEGFDTDWVPMGTRRSVTYGRLPAGSYRFRVTACNNDGLWNAQGAVLAFELKPHFYNTLWFYSLAVLALILTTCGAFRLRLSQLRARERKLVALVGERTTQLSEANLALEERTVQLGEANRALEDANRQLTELSNRDPLTAVANRRHFEELLDTEWRRASRTGHPLSLLMADVDSFKAYNDTYGHPEGDTCLQCVALTLQSGLRRAGDVLARYGGEEFMVLLPDLPIDQAAALAEELRARVHALQIPHRNALAVPFVTVSFGVATCIPTEWCTSAGLVAAADRALYRAKELGRNRVEVAPRGTTSVAGQES